MPGSPPTLVHRLPAHLKLLALMSFVLVVVTTPPRAFWAFAAYAALLAGAVTVARVPARTIAARMLIEVPFVAFAVLLPFVATGPRVEVAGLSLSEPGLLGSWNLLAKATLGVAASALLAATTAPRDLLAGLQRLRLPALLVEILAFMIRYAEVVRDELRRMRIARESRGFEPRHLGHLPVLARSAGALFVRSYERGERVHVSMLSRGYAGRLPLVDERPAPAAARVAAAVLPVAALLVAMGARLTR